jgi:hypothetical protein
MPDNSKSDPTSPSEGEREQRLVPLKKLFNPSPEDFVEASRRLPEIAKLRKLFKVRDDYDDYGWPWGAAAEYLYRALVSAYNLEHDEEELVRLAKRKPGRKEERALANRIWTLRAERKTVPQIVAIFEAEGQYFSKGKIESYLKTRRRNKLPINP